ncbi:MAG: 50S ribosomal protein L19e [Halobacteriota archaeon]
MTGLSNQKRIAAEVLNVGLSRVWLDPDKLTDVANAITREDIRGLIEEGTVKARQAQGISRGRARGNDAKRKKGHRTGQGNRKGGKNARSPKKHLWMRKIRAQRRTLRELRDDNTLDRTMYRRMYRKAKGGEYRTVSVLNSQIEIAIAARRQE